MGTKFYLFDVCVIEEADCDEVVTELSQQLNQLIAAAYPGGGPLVII